MLVIFRDNQMLYDVQLTKWLRLGDCFSKVSKNCWNLFKMRNINLRNWSLLLFAFFSIGQVDEFFQIWQDPQFSTKPKQGYVSIKAWLEDNRLNYHHCLYIVAKTARCLGRLHSNGLVQTNLTADDILVKKTMVSWLRNWNISCYCYWLKDQLQCFLLCW